MLPLVLQPWPWLWASTVGLIATVYVLFLTVTSTQATVPRCTSCAMDCADATAAIAIVDAVLRLSAFGCFAGHGWVRTPTPVHSDRISDNTLVYVLAPLLWILVQ